jgi:hypothetical protein
MSYKASGDDRVMTDPGTALELLRQTFGNTSFRAGQGESSTTSSAAATRSLDRPAA